MIALTIAELQNVSLGYLTGADLTQWCSPQLLLKQISVDAKALYRGSHTAYAEAAAALRTKYSTSAELAKIMFTQATATAQVTAGALMGITLLYGGTNYISAPTVAITGGAGAGATATALVLNGVVTGFTITAPGAGYTSAPAIAVNGGMGSDSREALLVKLVSIMAVRNSLGNFENIGEGLYHHFEWADKKLKEIRLGQDNLVLPSTALYTSEQLAQLNPPLNPLNCGQDSQPVQTGPGSVARMVKQSWGTLG